MQCWITCKIARYTSNVMENWSQKWGWYVTLNQVNIGHTRSEISLHPAACIVPLHKLEYQRKIVIITAEFYCLCLCLSDILLVALLSKEMCGVSSKMPENGRRSRTSSAYPLKTIISPFLISVPPTSRRSLSSPSTSPCCTQKLTIPLSLCAGVSVKEATPYLPVSPSIWATSIDSGLLKHDLHLDEEVPAGPSSPLAEDVGVDVQMAVDSMLTTIIQEDQPGNVGVHQQTNPSD